MFDIIRWNENLYLDDFYKSAKSRGFDNNSSQKSMIDCFRNEKEWAVWILYYKKEPIGSVAAHSFDDIMGPNSYRIAARTCIFTDRLDGPYGNSLRTISVITKHQNPTAQFLIPACIEWTPKNSNLYITSNNSEVGTQKLVHQIFCPTLEKKGQMKKMKNVFYRGIDQTVWQFFPDEFYKDLFSNRRWC